MTEPTTQAKTEKTPGFWCRNEGTHLVWVCAECSAEYYDPPYSLAAATRLHKEHCPDCAPSAEKPIAELRRYLMRATAIQEIVGDEKCDCATPCQCVVYATDADALVAGLREQLAAARGQVEALREAIVEGCLEIEWFASRKKDLGSPVEGRPSDSAKVWADVLREDIADLRRATLATGGKEKV